MSDLQKKEELLSKIYSDFKNPGSLSSTAKLYNEAIKVDDSITLEDVKYFLRGEASHTLHQQPCRRFKRRPILYVRPGLCILLDVAYMKDYSKDNSPYLLFLMDGFSRFLTIYPLKTLRTTDVKHCFEDFLNKSIYKYSYCFTDEGKEFTSSIMQRFLTKQNIKWYTTKNKDIKCSPIERVIKTIKIKLSKLITFTKSEDYTSHLNDIVSCYNHSPHSSLMKKTPVDVHLMSSHNEYFPFTRKIFTMYGKNMKSVSKQHPLGTVVRLFSQKNLFSRSFHEQATKELFTINRINHEHTPVTYTLIDLNNVKIDGIFYHKELIPVRNRGVYSIKVLKKKKVRGRMKYLVEFIDYPSSPKEWIDEKNLE